MERELVLVNVFFCEREFPRMTVISVKLSVIGREMAIVDNLPAIVETFLDNGNVGNYQQCLSIVHKRKRPQAHD